MCVEKGEANFVIVCTAPFKISVRFIHVPKFLNPCIPWQCISLLHDRYVVPRLLPQSPTCAGLKIAI